MIQIVRKEQCAGCTACATVCPHKAIRMEVDTAGFKYPVVDLSLCTNCGRCEQVCAFHADYDQQGHYAEPLAYAVRHKEMEEVRTSRSGAMFMAVADHILNKGGVVYGAGYADHFRVVHKRITTREACRELKGSKYVQSDMQQTFSEVLADLKAGREVLFSGTPCQVAGLHALVGKRYQEQLYLCDIVCHGTPSPLVWEHYLQYWEKRLGKKVVQVNFRDKAKGWTAHIESLTFTDGHKLFSDRYTYLFYQHIMFRPSCSVCPFANTRRPGDLTLADFWGWQRVIDPAFNKDDQGCSLVLIQTDRGKALFNAVSDQLNCLPVSVEQCLQPNLKTPSRFHPQYEAFWKDFQLMSFEQILRKYGNTGLKERLRKIYRKFKRTIKKILQ